jgi:hypothetical protein
MGRRGGTDSITPGPTETKVEILPGVRALVSQNLALSDIESKLSPDAAQVRALRLMGFLDSPKMPQAVQGAMTTCRRLLERQLNGTQFRVGRLKMWLVGGRSEPEGQRITAATDFDFIITVEDGVPWKEPGGDVKPTSEEREFDAFIDALNTRLNRKIDTHFLHVFPLSRVEGEAQFRASPRNANAILFAQEVAR